MFSVEGVFHWNRVLADADGGMFSDTPVSFMDWDALTGFGSGCEGAGKGLIAMMVFAFIGLLAVLLLTVVRVFALKFGPFQSTQTNIKYEMILTIVNTFWFFLGVCIW